ncbi:transcription antitermination factor NusB [Microaceticoccus formicicus]|uniref:transcription antitermination factor NusB n=1 Tax=Microaceticoccus formicicus TaxID=3118105 RepID=UPI003CD004FB|nr:transcription antitermination factor NusB [Peptoniphilaceae bacterium AMB_02]
MSRKDAREFVMKYMYQMDINQEYNLNDLELLLEEEKIDLDDREFIDKSLNLLITNVDNLDTIIEKFLKGWTTSRIPRIDLAILRVAINEINNLEDIPVGVSINEAVDMAKRYSTEESYRFINGVLGSYYRSLEDKK